MLSFSFKSRPCFRSFWLTLSIRVVVIFASAIWLSTFSDENWNLKEEDVKEFLEILKKQANQYLSVQKPELSQLIYTVLLAGQTLAVACQTAAPEANNPVTPPSLTSTSATCTGTMTNMD